jgi:choline monooxygenase
MKPLVSFTKNYGKVIKPIMNVMKRYINIKEEIEKFNPNIPVAESLTPPSSWYTSREFYKHEIKTVFKKNWVSIGNGTELQKEGDYFTGEILNQPYIITKNSKGEIKSFYNICSHHGSIIMEGCGNNPEFVCPYHGWTYNNDGNLIKCTSMSGIKNFKPKNHGLKEIEYQRLFHSWFLKFDKTSQANFRELTEPLNKTLKEFGYDPTFQNLVFVKRKEYLIKCNWKVFIDNYLDGGYHVPHAHKDLSAGLDLRSYKVDIYNKSTIQTSLSKEGDSRMAGKGAVYAFLYPNLCLNRYGKWMDLNIIRPISETECYVDIEWFIELDSSKEIQYIEDSIGKSDLVQKEDIFLCENVQKGVLSDAYDCGRYVPAKEKAMFQFHVELQQDLLLS